MFERLFVLGQHLTPHQGISRIAGLLAENRSPAFKNAFIRWFVDRYGVDLSEAEFQRPEDYACFNDFFTRALKPGARPLAGDSRSLTCPVDGTVSQMGRIEGSRIFQAKGHSYGLEELLGGRDDLAGPFRDGAFATIYLAPRDYHRIHMPFTGALTETLYVPGRLFSVNPVTARRVPRLFARNERLVAHFETDWGPAAVVLVGAMIVAGIATVWEGRIPLHTRQIRQVRYTAEPPLTLERGEEMGRFFLGSTVILLLPPGAAELASGVTSGDRVRMGQELGRFRPAQRETVTPH